ncbi:MAG: SGNH/GDSL hydrolase family protein [Lachnospiraceae bacterium]|nr:SGNH/GDSL hydrolase family protein [Lachnospiraceae bacterium]
MERVKKRNITGIIGYIVLTLVLCYFLQKLLIPKFMSHPYEGAMIPEYYNSSTNHDVLFLGDCEFYESISPVRLFEEYGFTSYVRGSAQQLIWQSYYVLLDTLKYETPKVVVLNAVEMKIGRVTNEAYTRMTLDGLSNIYYRLKAASVGMQENESYLSYVFPILRYHSRWSDLTNDDIKYMFRKDRITYAGYYMQTEVRPQTSSPAAPPLFDTSFPEICYEYLDKITKLCKDNNIELVLFKAPTSSWQYPWYDEWNTAVEEYAKANDIAYINGLEFADRMNLDMEKDTYDGGIHLNVFGAEKCTDFIGNYLSVNYTLEDKRDNMEEASKWTDLIKAYHKAKES